MADQDPLCGEDEFAELVTEMVAEHAPRLFAVVQEYRDRVDGRIAAWGMAFDDHAEIVAANRGLRMGLNEPENAISLFGRGADVRARLVWVSPETSARSR
jgi:hypothetical protein